MASCPTRHRSPHGDASPAGGPFLPVPNLRRGVFFWIVRAFRAAVRTEVDRAMADRRAALSPRSSAVVGVAGSDERQALFDLRAAISLNLPESEIAQYRARVAAHGLAGTGATLVPFPVPANDHSDTSPPAA